MEIDQLPKKRAKLLAIDEGAGQAIIQTGYGKRAKYWEVWGCDGYEPEMIDETEAYMSIVGDQLLEPEGKNPRGSMLEVLRRVKAAHDATGRRVQKYIVSGTMQGPQFTHVPPASDSWLD